MKDSKNYKLILFCFFISGAAGLIYEIAWIRKAGLIFGTTNYAISTVIALFFGGMALGSYFFGKKGERSNSPLKIYALIEIIAGVYAVASFALFIPIQKIYSIYYDTLINNPLLLIIVRGLLLSIIVLPITFLIGGTLPLFVKHFIKSEDKVLSFVGKLYSVNTIGGVVGTLLAGLYLMPIIGANLLVVLAALLNILSGYIVYSRFKDIKILEEKVDTRKINVNKKTSFINGVIIPALYFLIGFAFLGIEILWTRFLSLIIYNTVFTYTFTLSIILSGIVLGSFLISKFPRFSYYPKYSYGLILIISGMFILLTFKLPASIWLKIAGDASIVKQLSLISVIMFLPSLFSGMLFPLSVKIFSSQRSDYSKRTGIVSFLNTFGGICGSLFTGFILIPYFGIEKSLYLLTSFFIISGAVFVFILNPDKNIKRVIIPFSVLLITLISSFLLKAKIPNDYLGKRDQLVEVVEGVSSNIAVLKKRGLKILEINRLWQGEDRITRQIMAAHIPMMLHQDPKNIALIGLGAGQTGKRFLMYDIDTLFCVDIEKELFGLVKKHFDTEWLNDEKVKVIIDDGNCFLTNTEHNFDLISLEVGQTFRPYLANFYTKDFYESINKRLNSNGVVSQFIPLGSFDKDMFRSVIKSFISVFPNSVMWYNTDELLLIGTNGLKYPTLQFDRLEMLQNTKDIYYDLEFKYWGGPRHHLNDWQVFAGGFMFGPETLKRISEKGKIYRNDPPALEYEAANVRGAENYIDYLIANCDQPSEAFSQPLPDSINKAIEFIRTTNLRNILAERLYIYYLEMGNPVLLEKALELNPQNTAIIDELVRYYFKKRNKEKAFKYAKHSLEINHYNVDMQNTAGTLCYMDKNYKRAVYHFRQALKIDPKFAKVHRNLALAHLAVGDLDYAGFHAEAAVKLEPMNPEYQSLYRKLLDMKRNKVEKSEE